MLRRLGEAEVERGTEVRQLVVHAHVPGDLVGAEPFLIEPAGQAQVVVTVTAPRPGVLIELAQPLRAVLPERVEHPEADRLTRVDAPHDGLLHQGDQDVFHLLAPQSGVRAGVRVGADGLRRFQVEVRGEDRESGPEQALQRLAQLVAPPDRRAQRLVARRPRTAPARQQVETVVDASHDLLDGQRAQPYGGELDRQRDAVEPLAQQRHLRRRDEPGDMLGRPIGEQRHRAVRNRCRARGGCGRTSLAFGGYELRLGNRCAVAAFDGQRLDLEAGLAGQPEEAPAGHEDPQIGRAPHQRLHHLGTPLHEVLARVQHEQRAPAREELDQDGHLRATGLLGDPQHGADGMSEQRRLAQRRQLHEPHPVGEPRRQLARDVQREPCLADPAHPGERDQARLPQHPHDLSGLALSPHKARYLGGQVAHVCPSRHIPRRPTSPRLQMLRNRKSAPPFCKDRHIRPARALRRARQVLRIG